MVGLNDRCVLTLLTKYQIVFQSGCTSLSYFLGLQNHEGSECGREIKKCLFLGRKVLTKLDSMLKSKDITLLTKVHIVKAMFLSSSHVRR